MRFIKSTDWRFIQSADWRFSIYSPETVSAGDIPSETVDLAVLSPPHSVRERGVGVMLLAAALALLAHSVGFLYPCVGIGPICRTNDEVKTVFNLLC